MSNVIIEFLVLGLVHLLFMLSIYFALLRGKKSSIASPEFLYVVFSFSHIFSLLFFAFNREFFNDYLRLDFHQNYENIMVVVFLKILIDLCYLATSFLLKKPFLVNLFLMPNRITGLDFDPRLGNILKWFGYLLALLGVWFMFIVIQRAGGLLNLWLNLSERSLLLQGAGVSLILSETFLQFSAFVLFLFSIHHRRTYFAFSIVLIFSGILAMIGGRSPVIFLWFMTFLTYFTFFSMFKLKLRYYGIGVIILILAVSIGKLREPESVILFAQNPSEFFVEATFEIPRHAAPYLSKIRRHVVILDYFDNHDFWYGEQYYSLLTSVIPRALYADKPVIDGGRLVRSMYDGGHTLPVMKIDEVPNTGWPEGNMAGFMNFGYLGLLLFTMMSALFIKNLYLISRRSSFGLFFIYIYTVFMGPMALDPYSIFRYVGYLVPVIIILLSFRFFIFIRDLIYIRRPTY